MRGNTHTSPARLRDTVPMGRRRRIADLAPGIRHSVAERGYGRLARRHSGYSAEALRGEQRDGRLAGPQLLRQTGHARLAQVASHCDWGRCVYKVWGLMPWGSQKTVPDRQDHWISRPSSAVVTVMGCRNNCGFNPHLCGRKPLYSR